jgi:DNA-binding transcriptional ArsR family regulator
MNIKVDYLASAMYDVLALPRYAFLKEGKHASWKQFENKIHEQITNPLYMQMIHRLNEQLTPLFDQIQMFYVDEFLSNYDFFNLLMHAYAFNGHDNLDSYLKMIKHDEALKSNIFKALMQVDDHEAKVDYTLLDDALALMKTIKALPTEMAYKWQLLTFFESPIAYLDQFMNLIKKIQPLYDDLKASTDRKVEAVAQKIEAVLASNNDDAFIAITNNLVSPSLVQSIEHLYISIAFPYTFMLNDSASGEALIWGLYMEEGFNMLKEAIEDETSNRVLVFKNLGDKTRYDVLKLIAKGMTSTKKIAETLNVSSATISYHINALVTANMITLSKDKSKKYDINHSGLQAIWEAFIKDLNETSVPLK